MNTDQAHERFDQTLANGNHDSQHLSKDIFDQANWGDWKKAFSGNSKDSEFLPTMTWENSSGAAKEFAAGESASLQGSVPPSNESAGLNNANESATSPNSWKAATSAEAQFIPQLQQIENELQTAFLEITDLATELGLTIPSQPAPGSDTTPAAPSPPAPGSDTTPAAPSQPAPGSDTTPAAPSQPAPGSDTTPAAPSQPAPGNDTTPAAPSQPAPGSDTTPAAPSQPAPGNDTTPAAPSQPAPGSDTTPAAPSQPAPGSDTTPAAPSQPAPGSDTTPADGAPVSASSLSTNPADYGATQQIDFNPATMVNVQSYGAVGDGKTDDTAAFNAALAAANAEGKSVWVPNGTYDHNGQIDVTGSAGLIGQSSSTVLMATDTAHSTDTSGGGYSNRAIDVTGSGATIENLTLTADSTIPRYGGMEAIAVNIQGSNDTVNGVTVDGGTASQSNFTNGIVVNALNGNLSNETITNNLVENTNADYIRVAAWNNNGANNDVSNVLVQGNMALSTAGAAPGDDSYSAIGNNGATITNYDAINNVAIGPKQWGNDFDMEGVEGDSKISGNYADDQGAGKSAGVVVQVPPSYPGSATNGLTIENNYFNGDGSTNSNFGAVALWNGAENISILNNTFANSVGPDISATGSGDSATLAGNTDTSGNLTINDQEGAFKGQ